MRIPILTLVALFIGVSLWADDDVFYDAYYDYKLYDCKIKDGKAVTLVRKKVTILDPSQKDAGIIVIRQNKYTKIKDFKGKIIDSNNNVLFEIKKSDLEKQCGFGSSYDIYNDVCHLYYSKELHEDRYPFSVEYEYISEVRSLFFWRGINFQDDIPVNRIAYNLKAPEGFKFSSKVYGTHIAHSQSEGNYSWYADSLPAIKEYHYLPDGYPELDAIVFLANEFTLGKYSFSGDSWKDVGQWYFELSKNCHTIEWNSNNIGYTAEGLKESVKSIYDSIIDEYRYVSVSIGIGGWKPAVDKETMIRKYGDCKGLSTLLLSQLPVEIQAYPVLALTRTNGIIDTTFPNFGFNHVFVMAVIDNDTIWMDPTCNNCALGELPYPDENITVLVIKDNGSELVLTPSSKPTENCIARNVDLKIDQEGILDLSAEIFYTGNFASRLRNGIMHYDKDEMFEFLYNIFPSGRKKYKIIDYNLEFLDDIYQPFKIFIKARSKKPIRKIKNVYYLNADLFEDMVAFDNLYKISLDSRVYPINLGYPSVIVDTFNVSWDDSFEADSAIIPQSDSASCALGKIRTEYFNDSNGVSSILYKEDKSYILEPDKFDEFKGFNDKSKNISSHYIKFLIREP